MHRLRYWLLISIFCVLSMGVSAQTAAPLMYVGLLPQELNGGVEAGAYACEIEIINSELTGTELLEKVALLNKNQAPAPQLDADFQAKLWSWQLKSAVIEVGQRINQQQPCMITLNTPAEASPLPVDKLAAPSVMRVSFTDHTGRSMAYYTPVSMFQLSSTLGADFPVVTRENIAKGRLLWYQWYCTKFGVAPSPTQIPIFLTETEVKDLQQKNPVPPVTQLVKPAIIMAHRQSSAVPMVLLNLTPKRYTRQVIVVNDTTSTATPHASAALFGIPMTLNDQCVKAHWTEVALAPNMAPAADITHLTVPQLADSLRRRTAGSLTGMFNRTNFILGFSTDNVSTATANGKALFTGLNMQLTELIGVQVGLLSDGNNMRRWRPSIGFATDANILTALFNMGK